jgi:ribosomal-protein-alanine N-acetyltransferase
MTETGTSLNIRRLAVSDLSRVVAIERRSFPAPWSLSMFLLELSKTGGICLAAEQDDQVVGYVVCSRFEDVWHVMNVAVAPHRRRTGVARSLIASLLERIGDPQARLTLEVRVSNTGARALYERLGFLAVGTRRRYYSDNGEDAVIMWLTPATRRGSLDDIPAVDPRWAGTRPA